ncbi:restriction endonuclease subunit S, partial [Gallibacterium salpingitidis]
FELPKGWAVCEFDSLFSNIASTPFQIYQKDINTTGKYPVISQSSKHIEGYSNNKTKLFSQVSIPIIIFGDHTKVVKFVNFPFIVGADGVKIITSKINPKFSYFLIMNASNKIKHKGYARHYSDLKNFLFLIPSLNEQQRIVEKIEQLFSELDRIQTMLEV